MIEKQAALNGTKLSSDELSLLLGLVSDGVLKPPSIERPNKKAEHFVFTPRPGKIRLNATNREIYERAMGLVAAKQGTVIAGAVSHQVSGGHSFCAKG